MQVPTCWFSFYKRHSRQLENDMPTLEAIARQRRAAGSRGRTAAARKHRGTKAFQERVQETVSGPRPRPPSGTFTDWVESESESDGDSCDDEEEDPDEQDHHRDRDRHGDPDQDDNESEAEAEDGEDDSLESEASFESDLTPAPPLDAPLAMTMTNGIGPDEQQSDIWQLSMIPAKA